MSCFTATEGTEPSLIQVTVQNCLAMPGLKNKIVLLRTAVFNLQCEARQSTAVTV